MISPRRTVLPSAVTAIVVALAPFMPAQAAAHPDENLNPAKGDVVSVETQELETVVQDPELPVAPPKTGDKNPGATMGQKFKSMEDTTNLSPESEQELRDVAADELGTGPSANPSATANPSASATTGRVGPAGSMSLMIRGNTWVPAGIAGIDVSGWQPAVNWSAEYAMGARFAYVKATEGVAYTSPAFASQYSGSYNVGMIRGAYHFALPNLSSGAAQADYFVDNGGGWSNDGRTLPGLLDVEYNPYPSLGNTCFNMSAAQLNTWIKSFSDRYKQRTGRWPAIYTTTDWWRTCTGNTAQFNNHPLHIAAYGVATPGAMPSGWGRYDIWQFSSTGPFSGDSNVYGGSWEQLRALASSTSYSPLGGRSNAAAGYTVKGGIAATYRATGGAATWGNPVMNEAPAAYGGYYQEFVRNGVKTTAYWHASTGAHMVRNTTGIGAKFINAGRERGYGFPSTEQASITGGVYQNFRTTNGRTTKVLWSAGTGTHAVYESGAIGQTWARAGYERGYGWPTTDEYRSGSEVVQRFSKGYTVHWSSVTGKAWVTR